MLLATPAGRSELATWPQYGGGAINVDASGRPHVHLNVLCYYLVTSPRPAKNPVPPPHVLCAKELRVRPRLSWHTRERASNCMHAHVHQEG